MVQHDLRLAVCQRQFLLHLRVCHVSHLRDIRQVIQDPDTDLIRHALRSARRDLLDLRPGAVHDDSLAVDDNVVSCIIGDLRIDDGLAVRFNVSPCPVFPFHVRQLFLRESRHFFSVRSRNLVLVVLDGCHVVVVIREDLNLHIFLKQQAEAYFI